LRPGLLLRLRHEHRGHALPAALDYLGERAPASPDFPVRNVYIGEFGVPENEFGTTTAVRSVRRTIRDALAWGCPYLVYWQVFDNECAAGKSDEKGDCRGFWLIKPSGARSALWSVLNEALRPQRPAAIAPRAAAPRKRPNKRGR
jgi:hypothetical protein